MWNDEIFHYFAIDFRILFILQCSMHRSSFSLTTHILRPRTPLTRAIATLLNPCNNGSRLSIRKDKATEFPLLRFEHRAYIFVVCNLWQPHLSSILATLLRPLTRLLALSPSRPVPAPSSCRDPTTKKIGRMRWIICLPQICHFIPIRDLVALRLGKFFFTIADNLIGVVHDYDPITSTIQMLSLFQEMPLPVTSTHGIT